MIVSSGISKFTAKLFDSIFSLSTDKNVFECKNEVEAFGCNTACPNSCAHVSQYFTLKNFRNIKNKQNKRKVIRHLRKKK